VGVKHREVAAEDEEEDEGLKRFIGNDKLTITRKKGRFL
jgi:hypothetical protein